MKGLYFTVYQRLLWVFTLVDHHQRAGLRCRQTANIHVITFGMKRVEGLKALLYEKECPLQQTASVLLLSRTRSEYSAG